MVLYSTHCPKCKVIEKKLEQKGIDCKIVDDIDTVVAFGADHNITSAPILELDDGTALDFMGANKYLNEVK